MTTTRYLNLISLNRKATWDDPTWGNVIIGTSKLAVGIICDSCVTAHTRQPGLPWPETKYAIETHSRRVKFAQGFERVQYTGITYHLASQLERIEEIHNV